MRVEHTPIHRLLIVGLQVPALVFLGSCKNDRTEPVKTEVGDSRERAVFGSPPTRAPLERRPIASEPEQQSRIETHKPQERARRSEPRAASIQRPRSTVGDSAERSGGNGRFLYYKPPGSPVGDPGERTAHDPRPQLSTSGKLVRDLLGKWADTLLARDLAAHLSLYAPVVRETVKSSKQRLMSQLTDVRRFEMYDVRLTYFDNDSAIADFHVESDAGAPNVSGFYRLQLRQAGGQWKIYDEDVSQPVSRRRTGR